MTKKCVCEREGGNNERDSEREREDDRESERERQGASKESKEARKQRSFEDGTERDNPADLFLFFSLSSLWALL